MKFPVKYRAYQVEHTIITDQRVMKNVSMVKNQFDTAPLDCVYALPRKDKTNLFIYDTLKKYRLRGLTDRKLALLKYRIHTSNDTGRYTMAEPLMIRYPYEVDPVDISNHLTGLYSELYYHLNSNLEGLIPSSMHFGKSNTNSFKFAPLSDSEIKSFRPYLDI